MTQTKRFVAPVVLVSDGANAEPTSADEDSSWRCTRIVRTLGPQPDYCDLVRDLGTPGERHTDVSLSLAMNRLIEVRATVDDADVTLFSGQMSRSRVFANQDGNEGESVVVTIPSYRSGDLVTGYPAWDRRNDDTVVINEDIQFQPEWDGIVYDNRSSETHPDDDYRLWIEYDQVHTTNAETAQGLTASEWDFKTALESLLGWLNSDVAKYIENPDLSDSTLFDDAETIRNVTISRGTFLPQALARLLQPYGFDFFIKHELDVENDQAKRTYEFVKRDEGDQKTVLMQAEGEVDLDTSECVEFEIETQVDSIANAVIVQGDNELKEVTIELYRAWPDSQDSLTPEELRISDKDSQWAENQKAWREWVADEAGDLITDPAFRTVQPLPTEPLDLSDVFEDGYVEKRRRFLTTVTYQNDADGEQRLLEPFAEYYENGSSEWQAIPPEWGYRILDDQLGIRFTGDTPPQELWGQENTGSSEYARVRVTGVIAGEKRLEHDTGKLTESPNGVVSPILIAADRNFVDRQRQSSGTLASVLTGDDIARTDDTELQEFAELIRGKEAAATIVARFVLFGISTKFELGDVITKIEGREISLNRYLEGAEKYPQVSMISHDFENQQTVIYCTGSSAGVRA